MWYKATFSTSPSKSSSTRGTATSSSEQPRGHDPKLRIAICKRACYDMSGFAKTMVLTVELSPNEEERLREAARRKHLAPDELVRTLLSDYLPPLNGTRASQTEAKIEQDSELVARVKSLRGSLAHLSAGTEDLHQERQREKNKEEQDLP